jgi:hypothetical protein
MSVKSTLRRRTANLSTLRADDLAFCALPQLLPSSTPPANRLHLRIKAIKAAGRPKGGAPTGFYMGGSERAYPVPISTVSDEIRAGRRAPQPSGSIPQNASAALAMPQHL